MESLEDCAAEYAELEHKVRKTREQITVRQSHLEADRHDLARLEAQREEARAHLLAVSSGMAVLDRAAEASGPSTKAEL